MAQILLIFQAILSTGLIMMILLQAQGSGLGANWTGGGETYHTKRGIEKILLYLTILTAMLFTINSILIMTVS